jgi:hypothetical protein
MKRKKTLLESEISEVVFKNEKALIGKIGNEWYFEIGKQTTNDLAEAVSILLRTVDKNSKIWNIDIKNEENKIIPEKSLYWLTGGPTEWESLDNYNRPWVDCYLDFQEEFGITLVNIINKSQTLGDIRNHIIKYLNLPIIYDFAMSKGLLR